MRLRVCKDMIAVVIPAHNEEQYLGDCLRSVASAAACERLVGESVQVIVVLDDCQDDSMHIALGHGVQIVSLQSRNVGLARALGAAHALAQGARWLSFTDADSEVAPDWLSAQLAQAAHCVCGTVQVAGWEGHDPRMQRAYEARYFDRPDHRHIHGANLGVCARAYERAGGFAPLPCHEDVALVQALVANGERIVWSDRPRVRTSARLDFRAPEGFGAHLAQLSQGLRQEAA